MRYPPPPPPPSHFDIMGVYFYASAFASDQAFCRQVFKKLEIDRKERQEIGKQKRTRQDESGRELRILRKLQR